MKNFIKTLSIIFIIAIISAVSLCFVGCKNTDKVEIEKEAGNIENVVISCDSTPTLSLSSVSEAGETNTRTLTAVVSEDTDDLADKTLLWSLAFDDPNATWAVGKTITDYVTITPSEDTHSCTVTLVQPFGETIRVYVTARNNPDATASATVDYVRDIQSVTSSLAGVKGLNVAYNVAQRNQINISNIVYGVGTIDGELSWKNVRVKLSDILYSNLTKYMSTSYPGGWKPSGSEPFVLSQEAICTPITKSKENVVFNLCVFNANMFVNSVGGSDYGFAKKVNDYLFTNMKNPNSAAGVLSLSLDYEITYNGSVIRSGNLPLCAGYFDYTNWTQQLVVNGVSMTPSAISF